MGTRLLGLERRSPYLDARPAHHATHRLQLGPDRWEQRGDHYYRHEGRWEYDKHDKPKKYKTAKKEKHGNKHDR